MTLPGRPKGSQPFARSAKVARETAGPVAREPADAPALAALLGLAAAAWRRMRSGTSLDSAIDGVLAQLGEREDGRVRGAVRDLSYTATRHLALTDAVIARLAPRPPAPEVAALLAAALAQLLTGAYAEFTLVDQAVEAARADRRTAAAAGFVNALLRQFLRQREQIVAEAARDEAVRFNVPRWWLAKLRDQYPHQWEQVLQVQQQAPPLVLRVNRRRTTVDEYLQRLAADGQAATRVGPSAVWLHRALPVDRIQGFEQGLVSVQDAGAQLAAPWLETRDALRTLDAGAAPGGKTAHLAELADGPIDAVERDPQRAARIGANLRRLGLDSPRIRVLVADAARPASFWDGKRYDRILLDAPCTASGIVRRHPDVVWLRRPADVAKLATQQARLLDALWPLLAPAGRLLYAVCSVFAEEGARQARSFAQRHGDVRLIPLPDAETTPVQMLPRTAIPSESTYLGAGPPSVHDGFFYALFEKT